MQFSDHRISWWRKEKNQCHSSGYQ